MKDSDPYVHHADVVSLEPENCKDTFIQLDSTASSALNSSSAMVWKDVVCLKWPNLSEKRNVATTKLLGKTMLSFVIENIDLRSELVESSSILLFIVDSMIMFDNFEHVFNDLDNLIIL